VGAGSGSRVFSASRGPQTSVTDLELGRTNETVFSPLPAVSPADHVSSNRVGGLSAAEAGVSAARRRGYCDRLALTKEDRTMLHLRARWLRTVALALGGIAPALPVALPAAATPPRPPPHHAAPGLCVCRGRRTGATLLWTGTALWVASASALDKMHWIEPTARGQKWPERTRRARGER
jgi:hypothetical protein